MLGEILSLNIFAFLLIFIRVGGFFIVAPGFSGLQISMRIRLLLALTFSFLITPSLIDLLPTMPGAPLRLVALIAGEMVIGVFIGAVAQILFSAVQIAGTLISFISAMANAMVVDPISQSQSAIVSGFFGTLATLLLFATNMHHLMLQAMIDSYELFPPGALPPVGDMAEVIGRQLAGAMRLGTQLAAPIMVVTFAYYMGLGLLTRLEPQIPIFFVAMPLQIVLAIATLMITTSAIMLFFLSRFEEGIRVFLVS